MWLLVSLFVATLKKFKLPIMLSSKESRFLLLLNFLENTNYIDILPIFFISHLGVEHPYTFFIRSLASKHGNVANKANL